MTDFHLIKKYIPDVYDSIEKNNYNRGKITGIHTGFYDLDSILGGMQKSNLIVVGGRPSMGKTAFVLNIVENTALKYQTTTAIFSFFYTFRPVFRFYSTNFAKCNKPGQHNAVRACLQNIGSTAQAFLIRLRRLTSFHISSSSLT